MLDVYVKRVTPLAKTMTIVGLEGFPMVRAGDDIAELIIKAARNEHAALDDGDVIVVAHKIVSKAEGRTVRLNTVKPSKKAEELAKTTRRDPRLVELVLKEARRMVKATSEILIVENRFGFVCINAGVDKSNVEGEDAYVLLPMNPDESARQIRSRVEQLTGKKTAIIVCDTYSRPFRRGQVEFAIGLAGINPFRNYQGRTDLFGYVLKVKNSAVADEIASAAELLMGQGDEAIPVVIIKGLNRPDFTEDKSAKDLFMSEHEDLFKGTLP